MDIKDLSPKMQNFILQHSPSDIMYAIKNPDTVDDALIEQCVEAASRAIDKHTNRTFYARTQTRLYNVPGWQTGFERVLYLDDDLLTVTTLTNAMHSTLCSVRGANQRRMRFIPASPSAGAASAAASPFG
jgi:hypothetical protein